jgi:hypothetical protein
MGFAIHRKIDHTTQIITLTVIPFISFHCNSFDIFLFVLKIKVSKSKGDTWDV